MTNKENTDFIDLLTATDMAKREGKDIHTIGKNKRYIKVRYEDAGTRARFKNGSKDTPYGYKYISRDDVKAIAEKQFGKRIGFI